MYRTNLTVALSADYINDYVGFVNIKPKISDINFSGYCRDVVLRVGDSRIYRIMANKPKSCDIEMRLLKNITDASQWEENQSIKYRYLNLSSFKSTSFNLILNEYIYIANNYLGENLETLTITSDKINLADERNFLMGCYNIKTINIYSSLGTQNIGDWIKIFSNVSNNNVFITKVNSETSFDVKYKLTLDVTSNNYDISIIGSRHLSTDSTNAFVIKVNNFENGIINSATVYIDGVLSEFEVYHSSNINAGYATITFPAVEETVKWMEIVLSIQPSYELNIEIDNLSSFNYTPKIFTLIPSNFQITDENISNGDKLYIERSNVPISTSPITAIDSTFTINHNISEISDVEIIASYFDASEERPTITLTIDTSLFDYDITLVSSTTVHQGDSIYELQFTSNISLLGRKIIVTGDFIDNEYIINEEAETYTINLSGCVFRSNKHTLKFELSSF